MVYTIIEKHWHKHASVHTCPYISANVYTRMYIVVHGMYIPRYNVYVHLSDMYVHVYTIMYAF